MEMSKDEKNKYLKCHIDDCGNRANLIVINDNIICMNCIEKAFIKYKENLKYIKQGLAQVKSRHPDLGTK